MKTPHRGLGIPEAGREAKRGHTIKVLQLHGTGEPEQSKFLEIFERDRTEIVEAPSAWNSAIRADSTAAGI